MIMDKYFLSEAQTVTSDADSTNTLDLIAAGIGNSGAAWLNIRVGTALTDGSTTGTLDISVLSSADDSTFVQNLFLPQFAEADGELAAGSWLCKMPLPSGVRRYVKLHYDGNTLTGGTIYAWITDHADQAVSTDAVETPAN
jgi:hypothetical protein